MMQAAGLQPQQALGPLNSNNNNGGAQPAGAMIAPPTPFEVPTEERHINPQTGRIQLIVSEVGNSKDRWICRAEGQVGVFQSKALFVAQRQGRGFRIFDVSRESDQVIPLITSTPILFGKGDSRYAGDIHRSVSLSGGYIEYKLVRDNPQTKARALVGTTIYDRKSLRFPVLQGTADRIVYSVIHDNTVVDSEDAIHGDASNDSNQYTGGLHFPSIQHIHDDIHKIGEDHEEISVFQSKRRFTDWRGRKVHRDVQPFDQKYLGRALRPSKKNLQIMKVTSGKTILQVGRLNDNDYALDFLPPYTPFQAFGILLAQIDAN